MPRPAAPPTVKLCLEPAVQGDVGDRRLIRIKGITNLNAFQSGRGNFEHPAVDTPVSLTVTVADAAKNTMWLELGGAGGWLSNAQLGRWYGEIELTFIDGSKLTWPSRGKIALDVGEQVA